MMRWSNEGPFSVKLRSVDPNNAAVLRHLSPIWVTHQSVPDVHVGRQWLRMILHRVLPTSRGLWSRFVDAVSYAKHVQICTSSGKQWCCLECCVMLMNISLVITYHSEHLRRVKQSVMDRTANFTHPSGLAGGKRALLVKPSWRNT